MSKPIKAMVTEALRSRFEDVAEACVVDLTGLDVDSTVRVRRALSAKSMRLMVVKNSLARRAFAGGPLEPIGDFLSGPCALVTGGDSAIEVAKEMVALAKEYPAIKLKNGLLVGDRELLPVSEMAALKGHDELIGEVAGLITSPGRAIAGCLSSPQGKIAGCLKTIVEREAA